MALLWAKVQMEFIFTSAPSANYQYRILKCLHTYVCMCLSIDMYAYVNTSEYICQHLY